MPAFEYKALSASGKQKKGLLEGDSEKQIRQLLRDQGLVPTSIEPINKAAQHHLGGNNALFIPQIKTAELSLFTRELYTLLDAGTPLNEALKAMSQQAESKQMTRFVATLHTKVAEGHGLASAMNQAPYRVPTDVIATIQAGEESGYLDKVLSRLAESIEQRDQLNKKMKTALIYPVLMVVVAVVIVFFLMIYVVPKVVKVFDNMQQDLPPLTQGLLSFSDFIQHQWGWLLALILAVWGAFIWLLRQPKGRYKVHALLLKTPGLKRFLIYSSSARWARTLGVLISSGVAIQDALKISAEVVTLEPLKKAVLKMVEDVREGEAVGQAMIKAGFFPPLLLNLVRTGEGKGQLDSMLLKGAKHYEFSVETAANTLVSVLEPILIIIMGAVVLTVVLAIMMPIFEMNQMVGQ
ncbi:type II secretion system protein GspF [Thiomicrorhabdus immobilis]|uniref:General secretion pathway protein F n=1 Tax=Thiomicrorhabdus immobilis TaxID=2791037 RepID=A0ABM7MFP6_9GAMM|nr:type II secretion system inner membrane protein GspF [Thiomicrorhabdus immobilis]BCN94328.1 type II secretion system protein GspF [Thiomicrorhabdus immobilis]